MRAHSRCQALSWPEPYIYRSRCTYGTLSREITIHTGIYGADIRFWPTLIRCCLILLPRAALYKTFLCNASHHTHPSATTAPSMLSISSAINTYKHTHTHTHTHAYTHHHHCKVRALNSHIVPTHPCYDIHPCAPSCQSHKHTHIHKHIHTRTTTTALCKHSTFNIHIVPTRQCYDIHPCAPSCQP